MPSAPRIGVITYPGSQDDRDALWALIALGAEAVAVWHEEDDLASLDAIVVPGGFSYGDYLRCGAIARFSPATAAVREFAAAGGYVLGICNGFQILCEAGLLPGALLRRASLRTRAGTSSGSATASRSSAKPASSQASCAGTATSSSSAATSGFESTGRTPPSRRAANPVRN